ncbi:phospho-sugar mutase [Tyzzerella sp. OttesenSCG-928-J15]|nr:phospho-sugar mutase [Tyzzerella sp. OttesenSCG-928-J15]
MDYKKAYESWLNNAYFDEETRMELLGIKDNDDEIKERFHKELEFGTGGLRGIIGAGTNRINIYTVRKATQGFANYLKKQSSSPAGIMIAYDPRRFSKKFAEEAALVMCANGIKAYVFEDLRPTPELSFGIRHLKLAGGIVITASHNPPEYNGYKVYGADGGQVPFPKDMEIIDEVNKITDFSQISVANKAQAVKDGMYIEVGEDIDKAYYEAVLKQAVNPEIPEKIGDDFNIVYTPLHGTGNVPVKKVLEKAGFKNIHIVKEQAEPDSNFTTVGYPNPEDPAVFNLALELAEKVKADIIIGTDPDADRIGAVVKNNSGEYVVLTGNMTGVLLEEYILSGLKEKGRLPENGAVISTIVSTDMAKTIAQKHQVKHIEVLTGFKYIGEKIKQMEENGDGTYLFGFEESYGCLAGTYARDKDAVSAAYLVCEMAAKYKLRGMTLYEGLLELYEKYGYYSDKVESVTLKGLQGTALMKKIMDSFRSNPPKSLCGEKVVKAVDYEAGTEKDIISGETGKTVLPQSNVLYYVTEKASWMCIRPSGTEPKIKVYFGVKGDSLAESSGKLEKIVDDAMAVFEEKRNE